MEKDSFRSVGHSAQGGFAVGHDNEVYTTTLEDVQKTAEEFGRLCVDMPARGIIILLDNLLIGPGYVKVFSRDPYGFIQARCWAVDMDVEDIGKPYQEVVDAHYKFVGDGSW